VASSSESETLRGEETSCTTCHGDSDMFDPVQLEILVDMRNGVHADFGLSCHDCHGGNPDMAVADDMDAAMSPSFEPNPYRGAPGPGDIPGFCGRCHSDPSFMSRFKPDPRVDQEREYWTSQHGLSLRQGDGEVATCVSCHGVHGILSIDDQDSWVHPLRIAETCNGCHGDPERMAGRTLPDGEPIPVDQYARWRRSVHAAAMYEKSDLTAPTCNDCHGNHGAAPPGVDSVVFVCGQCHGREASIFRDSPKHAGFQAHNEYLAEVGDEGCPACHDADQIGAASNVDSFTECTVCHGNHGVVRPTVAMFDPLPSTPCAFCHEGPNGVHHELAEPKAVRQNFEQVLAGILVQAEAEGLEEADRFDWLVNRALQLPFHSLSQTDSDETSQQLRPEFKRLFEKFRIGKTYYTYEDPVTGEPTRAGLVRCSKCHVGSSEASTAASGAQSVTEMVDRMSELTALSARAERVFLAARRGGVETREALVDLEQAIDTQINLEVLVHTFSTAEDSPFVKQHLEGVDFANQALTKGHDALDELGFRRRGLVVSLVLIVAVLIALGLKIREISART